MNDLIEQLAFILPIVALALLGTFLVLFKFRSKFPVSVNCWFCNTWTQVSYQNQNSWTCPSCDQYNGFDETGDYNKIIPEQYCNPNTNDLKDNSLTSNNGLCTKCNNNQFLKITQLANFKPIDENNFDVEVNDFRQKLEEDYNLCPRCENVLQQTLIKQKSWLFGLKLSYLKAKGQSIFKSVVEPFESLFVNILRLILVMMSVLQFGLFVHDIGIPTILLHWLKTLCESFEFASNSFYFYLNNFLIPILEYVYYFISICTLSNMTVTVSKEPFSDISLHNLDITRPFPDLAGSFEKNILKINNKIPVLASAAVILQLLLVIFSRKNRKYRFLTSLFWISIVYSQMVSFEFVKQIQLCLSLLNILSYRLKERSKPCNNVQKHTLDFSEPEESLSSETYRGDTTESFNSDIVLNDSVTSERNKDKFLINNSTVFNGSSFTAQKNRLLEMASQSNVPSFETYRRQNMSDNYSEYGKKLDSFGSNESFETKSMSTYKSMDNIETYVDNFDKLRIGRRSDRQCVTNTHFSPKDYSGNKSPDIFPSEYLQRPKPVLTPPRLRNISQASWVAGGYWKSTDDHKSINQTNFSRSSSQSSSGFGSQLSIDHTNQNMQFRQSCNSIPSAFNSVPSTFNSLPSSRDNSVCGDNDAFSVLSEPTYYYNNATPINYIKSIHSPMDCNRPVLIHSNLEKNAYQPRLTMNPPCYNNTDKRINHNLENISLHRCVYNVHSGHGRLIFNLDTTKRTQLPLLLQPNKENLLCKQFAYRKAGKSDCSQFSTDLAGWEKGSLLKKWNESFGIKDNSSLNK